MSVTQDMVLAALKPVEDPELRLSIVDLGLVYGVTVDGGAVQVNMGLTTPFCPFQDTLRDTIIKTVLAVEGVTQAKVDFVLDPPWSPEKASEEVKQQFVLMGIPLTRL